VRHLPGRYRFNLKYEISLYLYDIVQDLGDIVQMCIVVYFMKRYSYTTFDCYVNLDICDQLAVNEIIR